MRYVIEPDNMQTPRAEYIVMYHFKGKAIVKAEDNSLFTLDCEDETFAPIGEIVDEMGLQPITLELLKELSILI